MFQGTDIFIVSQNNQSNRAATYKRQQIKMNYDPKVMFSHFKSTCCKCKTTINKGVEILYFPRTKKAMHFKPCGQKDWQKINESFQDEEFYHSQINYTSL